MWCAQTPELEELDLAKCLSMPRPNLPTQEIVQSCLVWNLHVSILITYEMKWLLRAMPIQPSHVSTDTERLLENSSTDQPILKLLAWRIEIYDVVRFHDQISEKVLKYIYR